MKTKTNSVFGTQEQQDAAYASTFRKMYSCNPPTDAERNNPAQRRAEARFAKSYQAMCWNWHAKAAR